MRGLTVTFGDVLLGNITFLIFCCFRCVTHDVAVYKLQFFLHLFIIIIHF